MLWPEFSEQSPRSFMALEREYLSGIAIAKAPPKTTPDAWANLNRWLPKGSAEPGQWDSSKTPWTIAICRAAVNPLARRVVFAMGSQVSKTETMFNIAGHKLDTDPAPMLFVGPTKSNVSTVIEPRFADMLRQSPSLDSKTLKGRRAKTLAKQIAGVTFRFAWAGSPTELASQPAHTVLLDEIDRMKPIPGEGDVVSISEARIATYIDGRLVVGSSPTEGTIDIERHAVTGIDHFKQAPGDAIGSPIWSLWQEGTRYEWAVPCPHCHRFFMPRFALLHWPQGCAAKRALSDARLTCQRCGAEIEESDKFAMNAGGTFLAYGQDVEGYDPIAGGRPKHTQLGFGDGNGAVTGEVEESDIISFWVSGLCSPWVTFGQRAAAWIRAVRSGDQERVRAVINTGFGELYALRGDAPAWEAVRDGCAVEYAYRRVPESALMLFLTVDVQKNRLVYVVRAWGLSFESWLIEKGEIHGDTDKPEVWARLDEFVQQRWDDMPLRACAVDSGYRTDRVYEWCMKYPAVAYAIKGKDGPSKMFSSSEIKVDDRRSIQLWTLDDKHFKGWVQARFGWKSDQPGAWHVPQGEWPDQEDYFKQLVAEQPLRLPSGRVTWVGGHKTHDYLDCEAYQAFLAHVLGVANWRPAQPASAQAPRGHIVRSAGVSVY